MPGEPGAALVPSVFGPILIPKPVVLVRPVEVVAPRAMLPMLEVRLDSGSTPGGGNN